MAKQMSQAEKKAWGGRMSQFKSLYSSLEKARQKKKEIVAEINSLTSQGVKDIGDMSYVADLRARLVDVQREENDILESISKLKKSCSGESSTSPVVIGSVVIGSTVVYRCEYTPGEREEKVVKIGVQSEIIGKDIPVITAGSPLGMALMNHAPGFKGCVPCPNGSSYDIEIIEVK